MKARRRRGRTVMGKAKKRASGGKEGGRERMQLALFLRFVIMYWSKSFA